MTQIAAGLSQVLEVLRHCDRFVLEQSQGLHCGPLTAVFVQASAWWVKAPAFLAVGALQDFRARRYVPALAGSAAMTAAAAAGLAAAIKEVVDRVRPALADPAITALVSTPDSPSFPSGHAATSFAAAAVVGSFHPRLRWPLYSLATVVGLSRIYLGVHYGLDVVAGAALGLALGLAAAWVIQRTVHVGGGCGRARRCFRSVPGAEHLAAERLSP